MAEGAAEMGEGIVLGLDPGSRHVGVAAVAGERVLVSEVWHLPTDLTRACAWLWAELAGLLGRYEVRILAFETYTFYKDHGYIDTEVALCNILGVIRSFAGSREDLRLMECTAIEWSALLAGQRPPSRRDGGAKYHHWKRMVAGTVELLVKGQGLSWADDKGFHRRDALGVALWASAEARLARAIAASEARQRQGGPR
jgi:Holliday junction resolvasome RuvABC endonuclease subunit